MSAVLLVTWGPLTESDDDLLRFAAAVGGEMDGVLHVQVGEQTSAAAAAALAQVAREHEAQLVVLPGSHHAAEVGALLAHRLDAALVWDVAALSRDDRLLTHKRVLGGTWQVSAAVDGNAVILATPAPSAGELPAVTTVALPAATGDVTLVSRQREVSDGVALAGASVVVAGGRGLDGDLTPVRELAAALGGAVGATRDIVEEGWIGAEAMVGQTGTMIAPRLYIGAGLSGAPHHVLGMRAAETIVAINLDPDAPIMELADLAIVGDAATVLTEAVALLRARRA